MFSNLPTMLQHQDFQSRHADMLAAAREGVTVDREAANDRRKRDYAECVQASVDAAVAEHEALVGCQQIREYGAGECVTVSDLEGIIGEASSSAATWRVYNYADMTLDCSVGEPVADRKEPYIWDNLFARPNAKIGDTLRIRMPADYTLTDGPGLCSPSASTIPQPSSQD